MTAGQWMSLLACVGILILALLVLLRGAQNPLRVPIGLWALVAFIWNFATLAFKVKGHDAWHWLDVSFSPFTVPLALHIVLVFVGRARELRAVLVLSYAAYGLLALSSAAAFVSPGAQAWVLGDYWGLVYLVGWVPLLLLSLWLLFQHLRRTGDVQEQMRTRLLFAALIVGGVFGATEMWDEWVPVPALGHVGALGASLLMVAVVMRFKLFGREVSFSVLLYAGTLAGLVAFAYVLISRRLGDHTGLLALAAATLTLTLIAAAWDLLTSLARSWARMREQAGLGTMAEQIAHDLRSPLTALKGGIQYLNKELEQGRSINDKKRFLELADQQVRRIQRVLRKYPLLPDVEPQLTPVALDALVASVLDASQLAAKLEAAQLTVRRELDPDLPTCLADEDLLAGALENLVTNAKDAMPTGGTLTVRTTAGEGDRVRLSVIDTGAGMDPRQLQLAVERTYTTKENGSGLGLAWVKRIAAAHDGELELESTLGEGTSAHLLLPADEHGAKERGDE
jgi:two-component system, NtrC family, sensor histidine kinase HydH